MEPHSSFLKERDPVGGSLSIPGDSTDLSDKLQASRSPVGRGFLSLQEVALCRKGSYVPRKGVL